MTTAGMHALPLTQWQGLGMVAIWAAGALALGGAMLCLRDP
jgi:ABC-2 type transport system permease protein